MVRHIQESYQNLHYTLCMYGTTKLRQANAEARDKQRIKDSKQKNTTETDQENLYLRCYTV